MSGLKKYLLFTFIVTWVIVIIASQNDLSTDAGRMSMSHAMSISMLIPAFGALFARANIKDMGWLPDFGKSWKPILFAWLMPTVFQIAGAAFYYFVFPEDFDFTGESLKNFSSYAYEEFEKSGDSFAWYIAKDIFYSVTSFYTCLGMIYGLGEEVGWRGFMYPELKKRFGGTKGVLLGGVIHGVWHFPLMILVGYEYGREYIGAPLLGPIVFCVFTVSTGVILNKLYEISGSIWLPAIMHGATNATFNPYLMYNGEHNERSIFGPVDIGLISVIPMAFFAAGILYFENRREEMQYTDI